MTKPMFASSHRWWLPHFERIIEFGTYIRYALPNMKAFAQEFKLGPDKASSMMEHMRALGICEYKYRTYKTTDFFNAAVDKKLNRKDFVALLYFNYVHNIEPIRWLTLSFIEEKFKRGFNIVPKSEIFEEYKKLEGSGIKDSKKADKSLREAIYSLVGSKEDTLGSVSPFSDLNMYLDDQESLIIRSHVPTIPIIAICLFWGWKHNFGIDTVSLSWKQVTQNVEFPFRVFRMSAEETHDAINALVNLRIVRHIQSADLHQLYVNCNIDPLSLL